MTPDDEEDPLEGPDDENLRIEEVLGREDLPVPGEPDAGDDEPAGDAPAPEEPPEEGIPDALPEEEPDLDEPTELEGETGPGDEPGEPEVGPPTPPADEGEGEPPEPAPSLPGVGDVLLAEVLDGLGSRRAAWTVFGMAAVLAVGAYAHGLSDAGWALRAAFVVAPTLLLPAFAYRFPAERRTGHDRVAATYPSTPARYLLGRYLAYLFLGLVYLLLALAVAGPIAWYAGPHWVDQIPRHAGVGALVVAAVASLGLLLGTALSHLGTRAVGVLGLVVGILMAAAPRGVYLAEDLPDLWSAAGTATQALAVQILHLSPAVAGSSLLLEPEVFPVEAPALAAQAVLPGMILLGLLLGGLAFTRLQGPGGWRAHPIAVALFAAVVVGLLATPTLLPLDLGRGDPVVQQPRDPGADVTVAVEQDLQGPTGRPRVPGALTRGVAYDGFLALTFTRENRPENTTLTNVSASASSDVLDVGPEYYVGSVTVPAAGNGSRTVSLGIDVSVGSVPGAYRPADATAVVEVGSDQANFTLVADDLATAVSGPAKARWLPAAAVLGVAVAEVAVLRAARRPP